MEKNYTLERGAFASADGRSTLAYYCFVPKTEEPRALLQISHGMCEYIMRYEPLADYLTGLGYLVFGNDHAGHGESAKTDDELGLIGGACAMVEDLHRMADILRTSYPEKKHILLGHSMGSFAARLYAATYPDELDALVIVGTGGPDNPTGLGKALARLTAKLCGEGHRSALITKIAFGSYNKRFRDEPSRSAWLTRDRAVVEAYDNDKFCNYTFTAKGYYDLFDLIGQVSEKAWAGKVRPSLPIRVISGEEDPVGNYGAGVMKVYDRLVDAGVADVTVKLYEGLRHEIFNEIGREAVYAELSQWLEERGF